MIEEILPPNVVAAEAYDDSAPAELYPQEARVVANAVDSRRREFATARLCARRCLARLGLPPGPLLPGRYGAPRWPDSVTGSMSHCTGYLVAVLARTSDVTMLGIDAEPDQPLPEGVLETIALPSEIARLRRLRATEPGVCWDRMLFSMKEAVYKAWYPATGHRLDFGDADIDVDAAAGSFTARFISSWDRNRGEVGLLQGRWLAQRDLVVSAIAVPRAEAGTIPRTSRRVEHETRPGCACHINEPHRGKQHVDYLRALSSGWTVPVTPCHHDLEG